MKKMNKKRGFTITELVVVISVIAILAAVMIPVFSGVVGSAKKSGDTQTVRNMNAVLATIPDEELSYNVIADALADEGYDIMSDAWKPSNKDYKAYWLQGTKTIVLVEEEQIVYPANMKGALPANAVELNAKHYAAKSEATTAEEAVADINTAVSLGQSITLSQPVEMLDVANVVIPAGANVTIDLAGSEVVSQYNAINEKHAYAFDVKGELTLKNAEIEARGVQVYDGGKLYLNNVNVKSADSNGGGAVYVYAGGYAEINGGNFTTGASKDYYSGASALFLEPGAEAKVENATFGGESLIYAINMRGGKLTMKGCTISSDAAVYVNGDATLENCRIESTSESSRYALYVTGASSKVLVKGGYIVSVNKTVVCIYDESAYPAANSVTLEKVTIVGSDKVFADPVGAIKVVNS